MTEADLVGVELDDVVRAPSRRPEIFDVLFTNIPSLEVVKGQLDNALEGFSPDFETDSLFEDIKTCVEKVFYDSGREVIRAKSTSERQAIYSAKLACRGEVREISAYLDVVNSSDRERFLYLGVANLVKGAEEIWENAFDRGSNRFADTSKIFTGQRLLKTGMIYLIGYLQLLRK